MVMKKMAATILATTMAFMATSVITFANPIDTSQLNNTKCINDTYAENTFMVEDSNHIKIPDYDVLHLTAGQIKQNLIFENPEENDCYFKLSLVLADGTEIWTSELLEPGMACTDMNLNQYLGSGVYDGSKLIYNCYSLKNQSLLNTFPITVTLVVQ